MVCMDQRTAHSGASPHHWALTTAAGAKTAAMVVAFIMIDITVAVGKACGQYASGGPLLYVMCRAEARVDGWAVWGVSEQAGVEPDERDLIYGRLSLDAVRVSDPGLVARQQKEAGREMILTPQPKHKGLLTWPEPGAREGSICLATLGRPEGGASLQRGYGSASWSLLPFTSRPEARLMPLRDESPGRWSRASLITAHHRVVIRPLVQTLLRSFGLGKLFFFRERQHIAPRVLGLAGLGDQSRASSGPALPVRRRPGEHGRPRNGADARPCISMSSGCHSSTAATRAMQTRAWTAWQTLATQALCAVWQQGLAVVDAGPQ